MTQTKKSAIKKKRFVPRRGRVLGAWHPFQLYRIDRLAELFDVDPSTIHRWRRDGILPPFTEIAGVKGLTGKQLEDFLDRQGNDER